MWKLLIIESFSEWKNERESKLKTVLKLWGIIGVVGTDMRTGWGAPGCSVSDTRPTPGGVFLRENCGV